MKIEFELIVLSKRETLLGLHLTTHNGLQHIQVAVLNYIK
jgi:hypothetical protein